MAVLPLEGREAADGFTDIKMGSEPTAKRPDWFVVVTFIEQVAVIRETVEPDADVKDRRRQPIKIEIIHTIKGLSLAFLRRTRIPR